MRLAENGHGLANGRVTDTTRHLTNRGTVLTLLLLIIVVLLLFGGGGYYYRGRSR
jgi:hypothetical protein